MRHSATERVIADLVAKERGRVLGSLLVLSAAAGGLWAAGVAGFWIPFVFAACLALGHALTCHRVAAGRFGDNAREVKEIARHAASMRAGAAGEG